MTTTVQQPLLVLIAGPYRSGTGGDPALMAANLARLEQAAWPLFRAGHLPVIGEWVALPVLRSAGAGVEDPRGLPVYHRVEDVPALAVGHAA